MPKITVWKCPHTGELFEDETVYRRHLKQLSRARIAAREWQVVRDGVIDVIRGAQHVESIQELVDYVVRHQREFMIQGVFNTHRSDNKLHKALEKGWDIYFPSLTGLRIESKWRSEVSNSHNCPRNGYTNWGGDNVDAKGVRNYPGWQGQVYSSYDEDDRYIKIRKTGSKDWEEIEAPGISEMAGSFGNSDAHSGICTGSGGGGAQRCKYEVSLFQSDFPNMEKKVTFAIINDEGKPQHWGNGLQYDELDAIGNGVYELEVDEINCMGAE